QLHGNQPVNLFRQTLHLLAETPGAPANKNISAHWRDKTAIGYLAAEAGAGVPGVTGIGGATETGAGAGISAGIGGGVSPAACSARSITDQTCFSGTAPSMRSPFT